MICTNYKISVPNIVSYAVIAYNCPLIIHESAIEFLDRAIKSYLCNELTPDRIQETEIVFMTHLKDMTSSHFSQQPKSMLCRKRLRRYFEVKSEAINVFDYKWLPS